MNPCVPYYPQYVEKDVVTMPKISKINAHTLLFESGSDILQLYSITVGQKILDIHRNTRRSCSPTIGLNALVDITGRAILSLPRDAL